MVQYPAHTKYFECSDYSFTEDFTLLTLKVEGGSTFLYMPSTEAVTITQDDVRPA
jgi:hypothetical protein